jgi:hypothetical protein
MKNNNNIIKNIKNNKKKNIYKNLIIRILKTIKIINQKYFYYNLNVLENTIYHKLHFYFNIYKKNNYILIINMVLVCFIY